MGVGRIFNRTAESLFGASNAEDKTLNGGQAPFSPFKITPDIGSWFNSIFTKASAATRARAVQPEATPPSAETHWPASRLYQRTVVITKTDYKKADALFYQRHQELKGQPLTAKSPAALKREYNAVALDVAQNKYNKYLDAGVKEFKGTNNKGRARLLAQTLDPKILKSLLVQESNFNARVGSNRYGYTGIAQFGKQSAIGSGLIVNGKVDERNDPSKAIPAAARHLGQKADYLEEHAFNRYGTPQGDEYMKFVTAAYNGGEGTITTAMAAAYNIGLKAAAAKGLKGDAAVSAAKDYATKWSNIIAPKRNYTRSPLYAATAKYFPKIAASKYNEIGNYAVQIMERARQ